MRKNHFTYSLITLILAVVLISGCALLKGYGKVRLSSEHGDDMTIHSLHSNWNDYNIYYTGMSISNPYGIMFDPKNDGRELVGDRWTRVEDEGSALEIITGINANTQFQPKLHVLLGPDNQLYGYVYYFWDLDNIVAKVIDDRTL